MTLKDKLKDRIISHKNYYDSSGRLKSTAFYCKCPTPNCKNTVSIDKARDIDRLCRSCTAKVEKSKRRHVYRFHTSNLDECKHNPKYPHLFVREEISQYGCVRHIYSCPICNKENKSGRCNSCARRKRPYERTYNKLIRAAKKRRISCNISYEDFVKVCEETSCHYCGKDLNRSKYRSEDGTDAILLDRKDSNKGYTVDNVVSCCWPCNDMKGKYLSYEEMQLIMELRRSHPV